jgi:RNA polymerase sigma factor (sigma-70 family)
MASPINEVVQHLRRAVLQQDGAGLSDAELLAHFVGRRDQTAAAALVRRHAPMVWAVCRRILRDAHDAEDAFQATFLVLVRRAASITPRAMVGNWLYGVAHQTALKARAMAARRRARERQVPALPEPAAGPQPRRDDLGDVLDHELSRLPDKYRAAIVLCDLEGRTRTEAARQLGVPEGTLAARHARARAMLGKRLARRGLAGAGGALLTSEATAGVPAAVVSSTLRAVGAAAAGGPAAAGAVPVKVAALAEGVLKRMLFVKARAAAARLLAAGLLATALLVPGPGGLRPSSPARPPAVTRPPREKPAGGKAAVRDRRFTERQSKQIRPGMTVAQVTALLGCPPGDYTGGKGLYVAFIDPFPVAAFRRQFPVHWCGHQGAIALVLDRRGKVRHADWYPALDPEGGRAGDAAPPAPAEKKAFLKLLEKLPTEHEGFYTEEAITRAEPYTRVLLALTEKDVEQYAKGLGVKDYCLYPFHALGAGLVQRKGPREYAVKHFGEIAHPELKLGWAVFLFDHKAASPEIVRYLRTALRSEGQAKVLARMLGRDFEDFRKRVTARPGQGPPGAAGAARARALAVIHKLGGTAEPNADDPGRPALKVDLSSSAVTDADLKCLADLGDVGELWLGRTKITDRGLGHLRPLRRLHTLILIDAPVTDRGLAHLRGLGSLRALNLTRTRVTDAGLEHLRGLRHLERLMLTGAAVTDKGLEAVARFPQLLTLRLGRTRVTDAGLAHLRGLRRLEWLDLGGTAVTDRGLEDLTPLVRLKALALTGTRVTDKGMAALKGLKGLRRLYLSQTRVGDGGLRQLRALPNLTVLALNGTAVTDRGLRLLKGLTGLVSVEVCGTRVTEAGAEELCSALPRAHVSRGPGD